MVSHIEITSRETIGCYVAFISLLQSVMISQFQEQEIKILVRGFAPFLTQQGPCARAQSLPL